MGLTERCRGDWLGFKTCKGYIEAETQFGFDLAFDQLVFGWFHLILKRFEFDCDGFGQHIETRRSKLACLDD